VSEAPRGVIGLSKVARVLMLAVLATLALVGAARAADRLPRADTATARGAPVRSSGANASIARRADAPASPSPGSPNAQAGRAPDNPPLLAGTGSGSAMALGGDEPDAGALPQTEADPLVSNGLGSPLCEQRREGAQLSQTSRRDCETSGFIAAAAPTGSFGIDVHIDTGLVPFGSGGLLSAVQDLFVTPLWMALVWAVHALVVMLEWCFTVDLLDSSSVKVGLANGLRQMQAAFTVPWLASVLAVGGVLCAYNGLVRRRVAESLGQALIALAMIAGGSWVMLDPAGTIGELGAWANGASLGTLAVTARGTPVGADRALADSMGTVFAAVIEVPWCYLEFGDVGWCRNPARLDPKLRSAALAIASSELGAIGCKSSDAQLTGCADVGSADAKALERSASLLRSAQTNGAIFLALPANGPARNAINDSKSLLRAICQSDEAASCRGPTAAQAEFRTNHGTWARVGGLLLIVAGALGMLLLLGFVALRLLTSALFSLLYLMLAPAAVLAPALGDGGRAVFRKWAARLLGAVVSKLLFSFLLGAILAILGILANLEALGWWTQWLLMSAFWWGAFTQRHQALQLATGASSNEPAGRRHAALRHVNDALDARRKVLDGAQAVKKKLSKDPPDLGRDSSRIRPAPTRAPASTGANAPSRREPVRLPSAAELTTRSSSTALMDGSDRTPEIEDRLARIRGQRAHAVAAGNARRAARLAERAERVDREDATQRRGPGRRPPALGASPADETGAADAHAAASSALSTTGHRFERFLDAQAALPASDDERSDTSPSRSYAALAGLAGYGRREYERLGRPQMQAARERIDRELALRSEQAPIVRQGLQTADSSMGDSEPASAHARPRPRNGEMRPDWRQPSESEVMRDAREVEARRKRQLGRGLP
jgi:hypothetical protein